MPEERYSDEELKLLAASEPTEKRRAMARELLEFRKAPIDPPPVATDGRPCAMDIFVGKLFEDCVDDFDRCDAIRSWLEGDWEEAAGYLSEANRNNLRGDRT